MCATTTAGPADACAGRPACQNLKTRAWAAASGKRRRNGIRTLTQNSCLYAMYSYICPASRFDGSVAFILTWIWSGNKRSTAGPNLPTTFLCNTALEKAIGLR